MSEDNQQSYFEQYEEARRTGIVKIKPLKLKCGYELIYSEDYATAFRQIESEFASIVSSEIYREMNNYYMNTLLTESNHE